MSLDAIGIVSKDMKRSVEFFALLGIELKEVGGGSEHLEGTTPSGVRLMLDSFELIKKISPDWEEPAGSNVVLCFLQESPEKVDEVYKNIIGSGFKSAKEPWDAFWGQRYASVVGPDGNQVDLFAAL